VLRDVSSSDAIAKTIVFCETKRNADALTRSLVSAGWPTGALHGDKEQRERD
jgi:ATP-dependent RNA helicase DDX5/DBP2